MEKHKVRQQLKKAFFDFKSKYLFSTALAVLAVKEL